MPQQLPDFSTFGVGSTSILMQGFETGGDGFQMSGTVTSLIGTPAPGTLALMGLAPLITNRRRWSRPDSVL